MASTQTANPKAYRLPTHALPRHYDIALDARLGSPEFRGHLAIQLDIVAPSDTIELHARALTISAATLTAQGDTTQGSVTLDADRELAIIALGKTIQPGSATLDLDYTGKISDGLEGLYLAAEGPYQMLTTQCEATGARAIFPCFDEPAFKARFTWKVTTSPEMAVYSNGPLVSATPSADGSSKTWTFATTKTMSSYLVALCIGDIASTRELVVEGVPLRVLAMSGKEQMGEFALNYTAKLLPWYNDYFAIPYHFDKLDQIGVPAFGAGAMENAGLIISREVVALVDPKTASRRQEALVAAVTAHEFAHMWFGDLVTMRWWDDLWLNEAFASWMSYHVVDALTPEYHVWDEAQDRKTQALRTDAMANTHPIYNPVETPAGINENFDEITYEKGCTVLRMLHDYLGDTAFRNGLRTYMREFSESNATGADLWRHLQAASNEPVAQIAESWIMQEGHPLVRVEIAWNGGNASLRLSQRRFFSGPAAGQGNEQLWSVPVFVRYEDSAGVHDTHYLLTERSATFPLPVTGSLAWLYANARDIGFYRPQLDTSLQNALLQHLDRLEPSEQMGLLRDQAALMESGAQSMTAFLPVLDALTASDNYLVIGQVVGELDALERMLEEAGDTQALAGFRAWVGRAFGGKLASFGFEPREGESPDEAAARARVVAAMTRFAHDPNAIAQAREIAAREAEQPTSVDANLAPVVVGATAQFGDAATFDRFLAIYKQRVASGASPSEVNRYLGSFGQFQQPEIATRSLALLDDGTIQLQNWISVVVPLTVDPRTQTLGWEFLKAHWDYIAERAGFFVPPLVAFTGELSPTLRGDLTAFLDGHLHGEYAVPYARALERMDQRAELQARTRGELTAWFRGRA